MEEKLISCQLTEDICTKSDMNYNDVKRKVRDITKFVLTIRIPCSMKKIS